MTFSSQQTVVSRQKTRQKALGLKHLLAGGAEWIEPRPFDGLTVTRIFFTPQRRATRAVIVPPGYARPKPSKPYLTPRKKAVLAAMFRGRPVSA